MAISRVWSSLSAPDYMLMHRVNRWMAPAWLRWWMIGATRGGDGWFWVACGLILLISHDAASYSAFLAAAIASSSGIMVFRALKTIVGRQRPCHQEPHCWAKLLPPDRFSFPSGHSITALAVVVPLSHFYPATEPGLLFIAFNVAISRIMLGMHFLSDVLAGVLLGTGLGYLAVWFVNATL